MPGSPDAMLGLGFGCVEVGTLTPRPQDGSPAPRLFRLKKDKAMVHRMGQNNRGQQDALERLTARKDRPGLIGINIGINENVVPAMDQLLEGAALMGPCADYLVINTDIFALGWSAGVDTAALSTVLAGLREYRAKHGGPPLFIKVQMDVIGAQLDQLARIALEFKAGFKSVQDAVGCDRKDARDRR